MTVRGEVDEAAWTTDMLYGTEPSVAPVAERLDISDTEDAVVPRETVSSAEEPVDLDDPGNDAEPVVDVNAGSKKVGALVAAAVLAAVAVITTALITTGEDPPPTAAEHTPPTAPPVPAPAPTAPPPAQDQAVPFTASADCPPGSTSAQALTDTTTDSAWVCVRGSTEARVDGQVLRIDFGRTHALSAVSVTPGWVAKTPGGTDEWLQHRVVTRLQYVFNDDDRTVFTQDTGNAHGPITTPLPRQVLASRVTVTVLATARPPASPPVASDPASPAGGFPESVLGEGGLPVGPSGEVTASAPSAYGDEAADPVDATFAMSALTFFGHPPK